jgi:hypothetical protein
MRAVSKPAAAPRSGTDAPEADDPDRAPGDRDGVDAASEAGLLVPPAPSDATALLATILSAALATASPGSGTANGTSTSVSIPDISRSGAQGVPMATGTGATAAPAGFSAESGPGPDFGVGGWQRGRGRGPAHRIRSGRPAENFGAGPCGSLQAGPIRHGATRSHAAGLPSAGPLRHRRYRNAIRPDRIVEADRPSASACPTRRGGRRRRHVSTGSGRLARPTRRSGGDRRAPPPN